MIYLCVLLDIPCKPDFRHLQVGREPCGKDFLQGMDKACNRLLYHLGHFHSTLLRIFHSYDRPCCGYIHIYLKRRRYQLKLKLSALALSSYIKLGTKAQLSSNNLPVSESQNSVCPLQEQGIHLAKGPPLFS